MSKPNNFEVVVIGAGMGGMLTACQLAQAGKRVLLVEKLSFLGGRFSGFKVNGSEIPTGAFHTFPHGANGPFSQALRRTGVDLAVSEPKVFASFHVDGNHIIAHNALEVLKIFPSFGEKFSVISGLFQSWKKQEYDGSYGDWLLEFGVSDPVLKVYERFCQFTLSTTVFNVPYSEGRKVTEMIFKYGLPGVPVGGAREVARRLGLAAKKAGVETRKKTQVLNLLLDDGHICGATLYDRLHKETYEVKTPLIISNIGPGNTIQMMNKSGFSENNGKLPKIPPPATGFKLQVISPKSLVEHDSIMFCLDTQRVAGIVQASNVDPNLAPPGKHLLISHQAIHQGADWLEERQLAMEDWSYLFGREFENCEVLGGSHFPTNLPVNWASQGYDLRKQVFAEQGLLMVGDGMKPEGIMMIEGVGANAESVVREILGVENTSPWEISQFAVWSQGILNWIKDFNRKR